MLVGCGFVVGLATYVFLYDRHKARIDLMEQRAYRDVREAAIKRMNAEGERQRMIRQRNAELPMTPEEEQKSYEESLRNFLPPDEVEKKLKERRKM